MRNIHFGNLCKNKKQYQNSNTTIWFLGMLPILTIIIFKFVPLYHLFEELDYFSKVFSNSKDIIRFFILGSVRLVISRLLSLAILILISIIFGISLSYIKNKILRIVLLSIFIIPALIPPIAFVDLYYEIFDLNITSENPHSGLYYTIMFSLRERAQYIGIYIIIVFAAIKNYVNSKNIEMKNDFINARFKPAIQCGFIILLINLVIILNINEELQILSGLESSTSLYEYTWMFNFILHLLLSIALIPIIKKKLIRHVLPNKKSDIYRKSSKTGNMIGLLICLAYSMCAMYILYMLCIQPFIYSDYKGFSLLIFQKEILQSSLIIVMATLLCSLFTILLAYPLITKGLWSKVYMCFLIVTLCLNEKVFNIIEATTYLHTLGGYIPFFVYSSINISGVFVLAWVFEARNGKLIERARGFGIREIKLFFKVFVKKSIKPLSIISLFQFVYLWGYIKNPIWYFLSFSNIPKQYAQFFLIPSNQYKNISFYYTNRAVLCLIPVIIFFIIQVWRRDDSIL